MIKSFLILINLSIFLYASQQIVLVVADDFNTSKAQLECFEDGKKIFQTIDVNIGKKGLGWGLGEKALHTKKSDPIKHEGDKKAPSGIFKLSSIFGYAKSNKVNLPYLHTSENLICVDSAESKYYNQIILSNGKKPKSFEYMKRQDSQYELGIVVEHNKQAISNRGSCIFLHVQKTKDAGTAGCTSMTLNDLQKITTWIDGKKNPLLIQIQKSSSQEILSLYPQLHTSTLLQSNH